MTNKEFKYDSVLSASIVMVQNFQCTVYKKQTQDPTANNSC